MIICSIIVLAIIFLWIQTLFLICKFAVRARLPEILLTVKEILNIWGLRLWASAKRLSGRITPFPVLFGSFNLTFSAEKFKSRRSIKSFQIVLLRIWEFVSKFQKSQKEETPRLLGRTAGSTGSAIKEWIEWNAILIKWQAEMHGARVLSAASWNHNIAVYQTAKFCCCVGFEFW